MINLDERSTIRQEIRNTVTKLGMAVILLLAACALMPAQEVSTNAMPGVDFLIPHLQVGHDRGRNLSQSDRRHTD